MIILFPMLTSKTVSKSVLPGICKNLEKFILIYKMDSILKTTGMVGATIGVMKMAGTAIMGAAGIAKMKESVSLEEQQRRGPGTKPQTQRTPYDRIKDFTSPQEDSESSQISKIFSSADMGKIDIHWPNDAMLNLEPTYVVLSSSKGTQIVGIKVIPFMIDSDEKIASMMTLDISLKYFESKLYEYFRRGIRVFWRVAHKFKVPFLHQGIVTDDPEETILFAKSQHGENLFVLLNYADVKDDSLFTNVGGVSKLFKMGWASFIAADDVNRRAVFCMKEFKGMCSTVPYSFLYANAGKDTMKVYSDLEDIRKSSSPFFKLSLKANKIFSESMVFDKLRKYTKDVFSEEK